MTRYALLAILGLLLAAALPISTFAAEQATTPGRPATPAAGEARRAEASFHPAVVYGNRLLSEDTVWRGEVLVEGVVAVAPQATLSIEPGTVVRFRRRGAQAPLIVVQG